MIQNLHTHTTFCDGKHSAEEMVLSAMEKGLQSLGFSGHSPIENENWTMRDVDAYITEINRLKEKYADKIEVFLGIEKEFVCDCPYYEYDYVINSVHGIKKGNRILWVDSDRKTTENVIHEFYNGDVYSYIEEYYNLVVEASKNDGILGHFDLITKFNIENDIFDENSEKYRNIANSALFECIKNGAIIEINTGAIERGYQNKFYPAPYLLQTLKDNNGKIILTSDAHNKDAIDFYYKNSVGILKEIGFNSQMKLTKNGFCDIELS